MFNVCFKSLQGRTTIISEQDHRLSMCVEKIYTLVSANEIIGIGVDFLAGVTLANGSVTTVGNRFTYKIGMLGFLEGLCLLNCNFF